MTDEFPALEVAAALGVLATGIRSYQLLRARQAIPHLAAEIEKALQSGQPARARELCQNTDATALGTVADALLDTLDAGDGRVERALLASEIRRSISEAMTAVRRRVQSSRARDLLVGMVLIGAMFYAARAGMTHNLVFYVLASIGALLAASGFALRPGLVTLVEDETGRLVEAALAADATRELGADPCPSCGNSEAIVVDAERAFGQSAATFGLSEFRICRKCGYLQGSVADPGRIPLGAEHGTSVSSAPVSTPEEATVDSTEHEG